MPPNKSFEYARKLRGPDAQKPRAAQFIRYDAKVMKALAIILLTGCFAFGCSYYGQNSYLIPASGNNWEVIGQRAKYVCAGTTIEIFPTIMDRDKKALAFIGIPYFPGIDTAFPSDVGELQVGYTDIDTKAVCSDTDLRIKTENGNVELSPMSVWKSRIVENNGAKYVGCLYKFGEGLKRHKSFTVHFQNDFLGCDISPMKLRVEKKSGYYAVPVQ